MYKSFSSPSYVYKLVSKLVPSLVLDLRWGWALASVIILTVIDPYYYEVWYKEFSATDSGMISIFLLTFFSHLKFVR